jgi:Cu-Zn family superoxide dismutase
MRVCPSPWIAGACLLAATSIAAVHAQEPRAGLTAKAELKDAKGVTVGTAALTESPSGVLIRLDLTKAPSGVKAFHIHQTGKCDPPGFESAGGHFNPTGAHHGFEDPKGAHAGDLPNLHVPSSGALAIEMLARGVTLSAGAGSLFDQDGSALMLHTGADDYRTDPSGAAGGRAACGVVTK